MPSTHPKLRFEIRIRRADDRAELIIEDVASGREHPLSTVEWLIAQHMDGTTSLTDLEEIAQEGDESWGAREVESFLRRLEHLGLLDQDPGGDDDEFDDPTVPPTALPRLRFDVRIRTNPDNPSLMQILDPRAGEAHTFSHLECMIAQQMNGRMSIEELLNLALSSDPTYTRRRLNALIDRLAQAGLFAMVDEIHEAVDPPHLAAADLLDSDSNFAPPRPRSLGPLYGEDAEKTSVSDIRQSGIYKLLNPSHGVEDPTDSAEALPFEDPALLGTGDLVVAIADIPIARAPTEETPREPAPEVPAGPPWYARPWVRRLRRPGAVALVLGILAVIPYSRYVTEQCAVLPLTRVEIRSQVEGILVEILVDEGDVVEESQVLARLDERDLRASIEQARAEVLRLSANLDKMKRGSRPEEIAKGQAAVAAAAKDLRFARIEADRRQRLFAQGVGSAELRDGAQRDLALRKAELTQAQANLRLLQAGFRVEEKQVAEAQLAGATADLEHLITKQERLVIRSPIAGRIITPRFKERLHSRMEAGETVCEVADTRQMRVEIFVPEQQIDLVRKGQPVVVKVQSLPLNPFEGEVEFIAPAVEELANRRHVRVVTVIDNSEGLLRGGMTGYGEIDTGRSTLLKLALRRVVRWIRVRFLI